jgi:hypothetical protein
MASRLLAEQRLLKTEHRRQFQLDLFQRILRGLCRAFIRAVRSRDFHAEDQ